LIWRSAEIRPLELPCVLAKHVLAMPHLGADGA
jgi:hypothetical protein